MIAQRILYTIVDAAGNHECRSMFSIVSEIHDATPTRQTFRLCRKLRSESGFVVVQIRNTPNANVRIAMTGLG